MNKLKRRLLIPLLTAGVMAACLYALEEDAYEFAMNQILSFKKSGYVNVRGERRGYLESGGLLQQRVRMMKNQSYLALVAGDNDLKEIEVALFDEKGKIVATGESPDEHTRALQFSPDEKSKYTFVVKAPSKGGYYHFTIITK